MCYFSLGEAFTEGCHMLVRTSINCHYLWWASNFETIQIPLGFCLKIWFVVVSNLMKHGILMGDTMGVSLVVGQLDNPMLYRCEHP